jgi:hypothetical protein
MRHADLVSVLGAVGKPTHTVEVGGGARVLLLPHGGRVLGLFSAQGCENIYWTHPALQSVDTARTFYASGAWENSGGDRTWLAPEVDIFFPRYPDLDMSGYFQPRQLDPGHYTVEESEGKAVLRNRFSLKLFRTKATVELEIAKWVEPTSNPLRHERGELTAADIDFCGYEQHTTLELFGDTIESVGLWNLIQMPHNGEMIVPLYARAEPKIYFGTIAPDDLALQDHAIRWHMRANGEQKIGIRAAAVTGRAGYIYNSGETTTLVVRNFVVNPSGAYIDTPWTEPDDRGYAVQACSVNSGLGSFSELEYHVPAIGQAVGTLRCEDVSQVWAFRGNRRTIDGIATRLLGTATS